MAVLSKRTWKNYVAIRYIVDINPYATLDEIGTAIGLTRERVRQIIVQVNRKSENYSYIEPIKRYPHRGGGFQAYCIECGKEKSGSKTAYESGSKLCRECSKVTNYISFKCTNCGKDTVIKNGFLTSSRRSYTKKGWRKNPELNFCSKKCTGQYTGIKFGFGKTKRKKLQSTIGD